MPEENGKQNTKEFYTNKYKKHITCSYSHKLVCVGDKFNKPFKTYLGKDAFYNFINSKMKQCEYCSDVINNHFNKELMMTKEDNADFKRFTKCWFCN